jgi:hypothetical protein
VIVSGGGVELGESGRDSGQVIFAGPLFEDQPFEHAIVGQAAHLHGVFGDAGAAINTRYFLSERETVSLIPNRKHSQIDAGSEAAVQTHFLLRKMISPFNRRVVEKRKANCFSDFVDELAGQEHARNVCLYQFNLGWTLWVKLRPRHGGD